MRYSFTSIVFGTLLIALLALAPQSVFASRLVAIPQSAATGLGQEMRIDIVIDTEIENVNAVSGSVVFPEPVSDVRIEDGQSVIGQWLEQPNFDEELQTITFAGIVPNGFKGLGVVFSLFVVAHDEGEVSIDIREPSLLKNDGKATLVAIEDSRTTFSVVKKLDITLPKAIKDTTAPLAFAPVIARSNDLFDGDYFVMFTTLDSNSGIDRYEILESPKKLTERDLRRRENNWRIIENPAPLQDQALSSYIYIKAVDRAGNTQLASLLPVSESSQQGAFNNYLGFGILIVLVVAGSYWFFFRRRKA